jgi:hypothetical protein
MYVRSQSYKLRTGVCACVSVCVGGRYRGHRHSRRRKSPCRYRHSCGQGRGPHCRSRPHSLPGPPCATPAAAQPTFTLTGRSGPPAMHAPPATPPHGHPHTRRRRSRARCTARSAARRDTPCAGSPAPAPRHGYKDPEVGRHRGPRPVCSACVCVSGGGGRGRWGGGAHMKMAKEGGREEGQQRRPQRRIQLVHRSRLATAVTHQTLQFLCTQSATRSLARHSTHTQTHTYSTGALSCCRCSCCSCCRCSCCSCCRRCCHRTTKHQERQQHHAPACGRHEQNTRAHSKEKQQVPRSGPPAGSARTHAEAAGSDAVQVRSPSPLCGRSWDAAAVGARVVDGPGPAQAGD